MKLDIDTSAVRDHTNRLRMMHRSALPLAVRGTLNNAAFDVKQNTMLKSADKAFTKRVPNFFKANSRVDMARGWNINLMKSTVGFTENKLKGNGNFAVKDLEQQEYGGTIKARSFIPTEVARGGNKTRPVRPGNRLARIKNVVNSAQAKGKNRQEKFVKSAIHAGPKGYVIGNFKPTMLWQITSIRRRNRQTIIKKRPVYSFEKNRDVRVKGTGFMRRASLQSAGKMEKWYIEQANRQFKQLRF